MLLLPIYFLKSYLANTAIFRAEIEVVSSKFMFLTHL